MVQGYPAQGSGSKRIRPSFPVRNGQAQRRRPTEGRAGYGSAYISGPAREQRAAPASGEFKLRAVEKSR